ncbi:MetQ/NlpA family ABC transporter substrate-binding protein [uncultured Microbacterium sp.]|uniref:MetQ/NlpA family ABC transporter substrate-binding protein n=1 Tax=uncultured Microbacterium sp. TaxID=191216 RepID=UPI002631EC59|nr:MetQ/NlpA family ABC transporter substrate-binding protein [uncultured Microbacterium sp.]
MNNSRVKKLLSVVGILATGALALSMTACAGAGGDADSDRIVLVANDGVEAHWTLMKDILADDGIELEVRTITDGVQLNQAVQNGDADINLFQHLIYLADFNVSNNGTLVPAGATAVYPLGLYSEKYASADEIPAGATIAIPNDATNLSRGLLNLQAVGLLELADGGNAYSSQADIVESSVEIFPVDPNQTVTALKDGSADAAIINNTQAQKGGLGDDEMIYKEDVDDPALAPYINIFAVTADNADDPRWAKVLEAYHSAQVQASVTELNDGNLVFTQDWSVADLQAELTDLQEKLAAIK